MEQNKTPEHQTPVKTPPYLSPAKFALMIDRKPSTVRKMIREGTLPALKVNGRFIINVDTAIKSIERNKYSA